MSYQTYTHFTAILALTANVATLALVVSHDGHGESHCRLGTLV